MPTQTKTKPATDALENAGERFTELNEKAGENARKASATMLNSYENAVITLADSYEKAAGNSKVEWLADVAAVQADFTREITKAQTAAVRDLVS